MDTIKRVAQGVVIETMGIHRYAKKKFGILLCDELFDFVERASAGKRVTNHPDNKSSEVKVCIARHTFVDEIDQSDTVTHPGDDRHVIDSDHAGVIDKFLCWENGLAHEKE